MFCQKSLDLVRKGFQRTITHTEKPFKFLELLSHVDEVLNLAVKQTTVLITRLTRTQSFLEFLVRDDKSLLDLVTTLIALIRAFSIFIRLDEWDLNPNETDWDVILVVFVGLE